jgi:hypothetical protein
MAAHTISEFKAQLVGGGTRPNQYEVELLFPTFVPNGQAAGQKLVFMCMASGLPASHIDIAPAPFRGRVLPTAGERTFDPWSISVLNDTDFAPRDALEIWQQAINDNVKNTGITNPSDYTSTAGVFQLDRSGNRIKGYQFVGIFPVMVGPIQLGFDMNNTIETFDCTFAVLYWTSNTTSEGAPLLE